jgi:acetyl/propionyl-CoA carboxylase alpha subunit
VVACEKAGLVFIGPTAEAVALMGNKAAAKRRMIAAGVPCVPGAIKGRNKPHPLCLKGRLRSVIQ